MAPAPEAKTLATLPELAIAAIGLAEFINADFTSFELLLDLLAFSVQVGALLLHQLDHGLLAEFGLFGCVLLAQSLEFLLFLVELVLEFDGGTSLLIDLGQSGYVVLSNLLGEVLGLLVAALHLEDAGLRQGEISHVILVL